MDLTDPATGAHADETAVAPAVRPPTTVRCIACRAVAVRPAHLAWVRAGRWAGPEVPGFCPDCQETLFAVSPAD